MNAAASINIARRLLGAVVSVITIIVLVVGVPYLLWHLVGWPLPGEVPNPQSVGRALTHGAVSDAVIIKAVALVGWCAWALLCWSLLTEAVAVVRGIPAARTRLAAPFQGVARQLIASASLFAATGMSAATPLAAAVPRPVVMELPDPATGLGVGPSSAATPATIVPAAFAHPAEVPVAASPPPVAVAPAPPPMPAPPPQYTVQRHDSLWKIAEGQLGDPLRWRELWELNRGRDFGGTIFTNPNLIYSGWMLDLPAPPIAEPSPVVLPPAESEPPPPSPAPDPPAPEPPAAEPSASPSESLSPLETATTAPTSTTAPSVDADSDAAGRTKPVTASEGNEPPVDPVESESGAAERAPLFAGGVVLASAALALLGRLRRSQARRRPPGKAPHLPPVKTAADETALRVAGDTDRIHRAFAALRAFAAGLGDSELPQLAAVRVGDTDVEVLLASPAAVVPPGFDANPDRRAFNTEEGLTTTAIEGLAGDTPAPWPAIVAAGALGDDVVLVDLESAGLLAVDGPDAEDAVRRIAAELATSPASDLIEVLVVDDAFDLSGTERIRNVASVSEAIDVLAASSGSTSEALDRLGDSDTANARRIHSAEQGWGVTVLVCLMPLDDSDRQRLADTVRPGRGVAAVIIGEPVVGGWGLTAGPTTRLEPHGFDLSPATLSAEGLASLDTLLADATTGDSAERLLADGSESDVIYLPEPVVDEPITGGFVTAEAAAADTAATPPAVEVKVLGPVQVDGVEPINRRRTVELIAYLALHPGGVTAGRLKTAIWPEAEPSQDTFNVTVHRARSALGLDPDGNHHLPHAVTNGGNYSVGPHVVTDLDRFNTLIRRSRAAGDEATEAALLRQAIELLRGQLFDGVHGYEWAFTEAIVTEAEATISDAAHRLAQIELGRGDSEAASWAAARGLIAVPGSEPLFRDRMEAAHLNGDPAAVDRIVDELCRYIETLEPLDDLHPDTIDLWRRIGQRPTGVGRSLSPSDTDACQ